MTATQAEQIAYHESAHAVVHHCFGHPIASIEIGDNTGRCVLLPEYEEHFNTSGVVEVARRESLCRYIMACCAGKCAMDRWHGYKADSDHNWKQSDDYKQALSYALEINQGDSVGAELLVKWLARRAELLVERYWSRIDALAFALLDKEKLSGAEISEILKNHRDRWVRNTARSN